MEKILIMKINCFVCQLCKEETETTVSFQLSSIELSNDNVYTLICKKGHGTNISLQQHKFQVLLDVGMWALLDGYPDAAVSRFSVALERFYEFCVCAFLYIQGLDFESIKDFLKFIGNSSEKEAGAFLMFYNVEKFKNSEINFLKPLSDKEIAFRNKVIHKGYIPSISETEGYAELIYNFIMEFLRYLQKKYPEAVNRATIHPYCDKQAASHMTIPTMISITHDAEMCNYTEAKEKLKIRRFGIVK